MGEIRIAPTDALVVVDLQPDFLPGGALAVPEGDAVVPVIAPLPPRFATVVATQDWHPPGHASFASSHPGRQPFETIERFGHPQVLWPDHCVQGTTGASLVPELPTEPVTLILRKGTHPEVDSYSAFRENYGPDGTRAPTGLAGYLRERGVRRVFVCGLARDFCVRWTAEDAAHAGFETFVLDDATRPVVPDGRAETDRAFADAGIRLVRTSDLSP